MAAADGIIVPVPFATRVSLPGVILESATHMSETLDARRKRLIHRSRYTGMKETDILLGSFAMQYVPVFTAAELDAYERLLTEQDPDIFDWATGRSAAPQEHNTPVLKLLINHRVA